MLAGSNREGESQRGSRARLYPQLLAAIQRDLTTGR